MFLTLLAMATSVAQVAEPAQSVQSRNGEFIFRQYPPRAKAAGEQGSVHFRAEVDARGKVVSCKVTGSSGHRRLDDETCAMIVNHASFKPILDSEGKAREAVHDGVVNWRLPGVAASPVVQVASTEAPDKIICRRVPKTGSLVSFSRLCMTSREWDEAAEQHRVEWGAMQGRFGSTRGN